MNRPICDCNAKLKILDANIDGKEYDVEGYACCECGEEFFSYEQKGKIDALVKRARVKLSAKPIASPA